MRKLAAVLLSLVAWPCGAELRTGSFSSPSLGREVGYVADVPPSYASGEGRYPVVYALHGLFESSAFWERRGLAAAFAAARERGDLPELIVIAPDGSNSFFVNGLAGRFEDMVATDLVAHVERSFRVVPGRSGRALFGVSMGGYGALRMAFKHPERFAAAAAHSAMVLERIPTTEDGARRGQLAAFTRVFGDPIDASAWAADDPLGLAARLDPRTVPALYFDCGSEDRYRLFVGNEDLHKKLESRGIRHEFALYPGDHGYEYVRSVIDKSVRFLGAALRPALAAPGASGSRDP